MKSKLLENLLETVSWVVDEETAQEALDRALVDLPERTSGTCFGRNYNFTAWACENCKHQDLCTTETFKELKIPLEHLVARLPKKVINISGLTDDLMISPQDFDCLETFHVFYHPAEGSDEIANVLNGKYKVTSLDFYQHVIETTELRDEKALISALLQQEELVHQGVLKREAK